MFIKNTHYELELDDKTGAIRSLKNAKGREFISFKGQPLAEFSLIENGKAAKYDTNSFESLSFSQQEGRLEINYQGIGERQINITAVLCHDSSPAIRWRLKYSNFENTQIEYFKFPVIFVPDDLKNNGGKSTLFTSAMEGAVVEDSTIRDNTFVKYSPPSFPSKGWEGAYPGANPMQFLAYYSEDGGLYFASHDDKFNTKAIEWQRGEGYILLEQVLFPGVFDNTAYSYEYDVVLSLFEGDWYDAAEIYREWVETSDIVKDLPKFRELDSLPSWIYDDIIVTVYPVRGSKDTGDMSPNVYYPYTNALPYLDRLKEELGSNIMALLCHWEGTAPWAPPFVWPPFGDKENFMQFVSELHKRGMLFGLYCSGIAWTQHSNLIEYNMEKYFEEHNLKEIMIDAPDGSMPLSLLCNGPIRSGYDMCPACKRTKEIALKEIEKVLEADVDYLQFFDQFLGGGAYRCYSDKHGHPASPGKWQEQACRDLYEEINEMLINMGREKLIIGCEGVASEANLKYLRFNDSRYNINYLYAIPVPAYNYVYGEYVYNFMGNQNTQHHTIDYERYPENYFYRLGYSFAQGDALTIVLQDEGKLHWDWGTPWTVKEVEQESAKAFIKMLGEWKKNLLHNHFMFGRMKKPLKTDAGVWTVDIKYGGQHNFPSIITTRYVYEGDDLQIFVNYLDKSAEFNVDIADNSQAAIVDKYGNVIKSLDRGNARIFMEPRSVAVLKLR